MKPKAFIVFQWVIAALLNRIIQFHKHWVFFFPALQGNCITNLLTFIQQIYRMSLVELKLY